MLLERELYIGVATFLSSQPGPIYSLPSCYAISTHPFRQHSASLCTGILGHNYLEFPHSSMSLTFVISLKIFFFDPRILNSPTDPFLPLRSFPYGNGTGSCCLQPMVNLFFPSPRQCHRLPNAFATSWGKTMSLPTPRSSRRWTRCSTTARRWSGKSQPGEALG